MIAAALVATTGVAAAAPASAQDRVIVRERTVVPEARTRVVVRERTRVRRAYAYGRRDRRVCTVRYRNGERIRTCRTRSRY